jgi:hypothetical protein
MTTRDHNEGVESAIALQRLLIWDNTHGLPVIYSSRAQLSLTEGNVHENISPSTSGGILLSGESIALVRSR